MKLITLKTFDYAIDAHLLKSRLEDEEIRCFLIDENINSLIYLYNIATGGIKLQVSSEDELRAIEILKEIDDPHS